MQDNGQLPEHTTVADPLQSVAPGVSLLDSILLLLTPEQRQHFLEYAGIEGVVYANRAPTFDKPLSLKLTKRAFTELRNMLGGSSSSGECEQQIDFDDPTPLDALKEELQAGVRFAPPPLDWFKKHPDSEDMPIRVETRRFGIPCKLCRFPYREGSFLLATFVGTPDTRRDPKEPDVKEVVIEDEALVDPVDVEHLSVVPDEPIPASSNAEREFVPHACTTWDVLGPYGGDAPNIDGAALKRLVLHVATNRRYNALSQVTRERCEMLEGLVRLKQFASQYPYTLASRSGDTFEFQVEGPPEALAGMTRCYVYRDVEDGSRRDRVAGVLLERVGRRNQYQLFRIPEGFQCDAPPASGYLVDTGDISQLQKQLDALRELRHPSSRPHLLQLGTLLSSDNGGLDEPVSWESFPIRLVDDKLTERQAEAVRKALATPDICLIQGPPGTGKTRVISEIVRQAARKNWRVLLVAPTHVAVDNVLERIGIQEDVSPVRCVRQAKLEDLPEHIQEFTYERRSSLLANETGRRSEVDRFNWQSRTKRLASALADLKQCGEHRVTADLMERDAGELRAARSRVPKEVRSEFAGDTKRAVDVEQVATELQSQTEKALGARKHELELRTNRGVALNAQQYTDEDRQRLNQAEAVVRQKHAPAIEAATADRDSAIIAITEITEVEMDKEKTLADASGILALLDRAEVPSTVQRVVDAAVADTTRQHDRIVAMRIAELEKALSEYADLQRRIADLNSKADNATAHARSLKEAQAKALPLRVFNGAWWGSFFRDYELTASEAAKLSGDLQQQCPALQTRIREEERTLEEAQAKRLDAIEATRSQALIQQHDYYRDAAVRLPMELEAIHSNRVALTERLRSQNAVLEGLQETCRQEVEKVRATTHAGLLSTAQAEFDAARSALGSAETRLTEVRQQLEGAKAQVKFVADQVRRTVESRTQELTRAIEAKEHALAAIRERFAATISSLTDVLSTPPAFDAVRIKAALHQLTAEHEHAQRRLAFLEEWTQHLSRESGNLKERLAQYVNLVCATTVGIATDEHFGDKGEFVEKQFDLLVVDEAGKVTEPEFLVAAVRAKRWVLVGDHKQLPPYYDQILDPYLRDANKIRQAADQPTLDAQALQLSIFERLWRRFSPGQRSVDSELARLGASRCVTLDVQRRMHPDLAVFVSEMFYGGQYYSPDGDAYRQSKALDLVHFPKPVTFIDICPGKGTDGYEVDLSKRDQREKHLAAHISQESDERFKLPSQGYANPQEAKQVIEVLETIVSDAALQREHAELGRTGDQVPLIGVIALYAGQVKLIHRLIRSSDTLQAVVSGNDWLCWGMRISVNTVDAFQGKECPVTILSFTRSNRRKAVGFVEDSNRLNVALSRARKKLVLVGDAETLTRRVKERPDGNKDSRAAGKERDFFVQLIRYVEGRGKTMRVFERRSVS